MRGSGGKREKEKTQNGGAERTLRKTNRVGRLRSKKKEASDLDKGSHDNDEIHTIPAVGEVDPTEAEHLTKKYRGTNGRSRDNYHATALSILSTVGGGAHLAGALYDKSNDKKILKCQEDSG